MPLTLICEAVMHKWNLNSGGIALVWRVGCSIRPAFVGDIKKAVSGRKTG